MNSDVDLCNVERQDKSADSVLEYWRQMIKFRKANAETLIFGDFKPVLVDNGPLFAYHRTPISNTDVPASRMLIVLNLTKKDDVGFQMPVDPAGDSVEYTLACSRSESSCEETRKVYESGEMLKLKAFEGFIFSY